MTVPQIKYYLQHLPLIEARRALPIAQQHADLLNIAGGKGEVDEHGNEVKSDKPRKPAHLFFTADEILARLGYASFDVSGSGSGAARMSRAAAVDLLESTASLPSWALDLAPIDEAKAVAA